MKEGRWRGGARVDGAGLWSGRGYGRGGVMTGAGLVGGDVRGAAAVAGGLGSLDVQVEQLHLSEGNNPFT